MKEVLYRAEQTKFFNQEYRNFSDLEAVEKSEIEFVQSRKKHRGIFTRTFFDSSEKTYLENYGNKLYAVHKSQTILVVEKYDNKVSFKHFQLVNQRGVGVTWFKKHKVCNYMTVNLDTGDVYVGKLINYHKKRGSSKTLQRNLFYSSFLFNLVNNLKYELNQTPEKSMSVQIINEAITKFLSQLNLPEVPTDFSKSNVLLSKKLFEFYLRTKGIKYPDNFSSFISGESEFYKYLPKLKELRKSNMKLIDAIMVKSNLKGKKIKKVLHLVERLNLGMYKFAIDLFGEDWIHQDENVLLDCFNSEQIISLIGNIDTPIDRPSNEEKRRIFKIFKLFLDGEVNFFTFTDHIRMYSQLKDYGEAELKWTSFDKFSFQKEHLDWTESLQFYREGKYTRTYPSTMVEKISQKIIVGNDTYYPIVLLDSNDYNNESFAQQNCVKSYIGKVGSLLISLRKNDVVDGERTSIEYHTSKGNDGVVYSKRVQTLTRFNQRCSEEWNIPLNQLDLVVESTMKQYSKNPVKITKECKNGVILHSDSMWNEYGKQVWTHRNIDSNGQTGPLLLLDF